jgi:hypothetical protein
MHNGFLNGEMLPFSEVGQMEGIYQTEWSWSALFADYDNDGDKDLLITNGYPRDMTDKDWTRYKAEVFGHVADHRHVIEKCPPLKVYNYAFENEGKYLFRNKSPEWFEPVETYSYGAAFADLDNDGDLDYVINNLNDIAFVYKNKTIEKDKQSSNFLRVKLKGKKNNVMAFGAKIEIWSEGSYQFHENFLSRGYISSVDPVIHFGLAGNSQIDSLKITWPTSGKVTLLTDLKVNQEVEINEASAASPGIVAAAPERFFSPENQRISYLHQQTDYIDYFYGQNILPHKFSQIGPCMQKGDLDGDGFEDLILGATNLLPTKVFLRQGEGFVETYLEGLTSDKNFSETDFAIFDVDQDGDNDVVALAGGYENTLEEEYIHYLYTNNNGVYSRSRLPIAPFSASVIRPFDADHDGDLDLFIGARIKYNMFPFASDSWILFNEKGSFSSERTKAIELGMVTDATWSDYDGDGWEDLIIAREWSAPAILKNIKGTRFEKKELPEIEEMHGLWYSVTAADFDDDGDDDYLLGNLGENHRFNVSREYPMRIYAIDLDRNGTIDPITTGYWRDKFNVMKEYPVNYFDELVGQTQYFANKYKNYTSFSTATIDDILEDDMRSRIDNVYHIVTTSTYLLWNDEGSFRWERAVDEAQISPITKTIVRDFNNDGLPDLFMAGNDHTYDISTGYYDANKGLLLMSSDGIPLNKLLSPTESGIVLHGMVESLLYLDGDLPLIVAGINRDSVLTYSVNR